MVLAEDDDDGMAGDEWEGEAGRSVNECDIISSLDVAEILPSFLSPRLLGHPDIA